MEVTDYMLVSFSSEHDLTIEVRKRLNDGWQPWGSAGIAHSGTQRYFSQALVKYKKPTKTAFQS